MLKNLCLLGLLTWVSFSYAKSPVVHESMGDAESFKMERPVEEIAPERRVAGEKIKKQKKMHMEAGKEEPTSESDSEVRYWQYSE